MSAMLRMRPVLAAAGTVFLLAWVGLSPVLHGDDASAQAEIEALNQQVVRLFGEGRYEAAVPVAQRSLDLASKAFGADRLGTAGSLSNLAMLYQTLGRYAEAESLHRRVMKIRETALGPDHPDVADCLDNLASLESALGRYATAEPLYQRALKIREAKLGPDHLDTAYSLNNLAVLYRLTARYAAAEPLYERALKIREAKLGPDHPDTALTVNNLAVLYSVTARYAEAEPLYRRVLKIREARHGGDHPDVALLLDNLASLEQALGRYAAAEPMYRRALKIRESTFGPDHPDVALSLNNLALLTQTLGRYAEAETLFRRVLTIRERKLGPGHPATALSLDNLASLFKTLGRFSEAESLYRRALKARETALGPNHPDTALSLNNLAVFSQTLGRFAAAESLYKRALKITESALGADHPGVALSLNNLAVLYGTLGRYAEAEPLYERVLKIRESAFGPDHPDVAASLDSLAELDRMTGRYAAAEPLYRRALTIRERVLGGDHPDVARTLNNLAVLDELTGRAAEAEPLYQRALKISEAKFGPDHPDTASCLTSLAWLYYSMERYAEAEPLHRRVLKIRESALGSDHPEVALSLNCLAELDRATGRAAAESLYQRALTIRESALGPDHPDVALSRNSLAALHAEQGRWAEAAAGVDRARRSLLRHVHRVLPALAEKEQLAFLRSADEDSLHVAYSLARIRAADPAISALSAGWVINGKGLTQQTLAERAWLARGDRTPAAAKESAQLREVRGRLAALTLAASQPGRDDQRKQEIDRLTAQERGLSRALGRSAGRPERDDPWVELDAVRQGLASAGNGDAVLVEVARFHVFNFQERSPRKRWQAPRYAAWVIPAASRGAVRVFDLGPAPAVEAAVEAARATLKIDPEVLRTRGEPEVERQARTALGALAKLVLEPLLPAIGNVKTWVISPDAGLWLVPWSALPLDGGRYVVEAHEVRYAVSGRDLAAAAVRPGAGQALVMADPDFGLDPAAALAATRAVLRGAVKPEPQPQPESGSASASEPGSRGTSRALSLGAVARLPGTAEEAKTIAPKLKSFVGAEPIVYTDRYALEAVFKAFRRPRAVVLSTHGFFLADQKHEPSAAALPVRDMEGEPAASSDEENPLLRCGLLLAGCIQGGRGGGEDGVLTGLEIVGADLQGTELVVLSACETGLGQVRNGEGVAGLRQAFQLAGVQSVAATLWQIPDRESARLMTSFFDKLAQGLGKSESLRRAQLEQIESRRRRNGGAHPFFWAAYTMTGRGD